VLLLVVVALAGIAWHKNKRKDLRP